MELVAEGQNEGRARGTRQNRKDPWPFAEAFVPRASPIARPMACRSKIGDLHDGFVRRAVHRPAAIMRCQPGRRVHQLDPCAALTLETRRKTAQQLHSRASSRLAACPRRWG